jgi:hypothetical protein
MVEGTTEGAAELTPRPNDAVLLIRTDEVLLEAGMGAALVTAAAGREMASTGAATDEEGVSTAAEVATGAAEVASTAALETAAAEEVASTTAVEEAATEAAVEAGALEAGALEAAPLAGAAGAPESLPKVRSEGVASVPPSIRAGPGAG